MEPDSPKRTALPIHWHLSPIRNMVPGAIDFEEAGDNERLRSLKDAGIVFVRGCPLPSPQNKLHLREGTFPMQLLDRSIWDTDSLLQGFDQTTCLPVRIGYV